VILADVDPFVFDPRWPDPSGGGFREATQPPLPAARRYGARRLRNVESVYQRRAMTVAFEKLSKA
jgi:hypothetical protein